MDRPTRSPIYRTDGLSPVCRTDGLSTVSAIQSRIVARIASCREDKASGQIMPYASTRCSWR
ncbi:hypothetical protein ACVWZD_000809 [Streptomyces sp. TE3672]